MPNVTSADRLALLYRIGQNLNSSLDLDEVLNRAIDEAIAAIRAERGFLMLTEPGGQMEFKVARGLDQHTIAAPEFQVSRGIVERVAREGKPLLTSDAQADSWLSQRASVAGLGLRSILCVPLQVKGASIGVVYVDNRLRAGIFGSDDLELLAAIAASAAIAIDNARLYGLAVEKGRLERELQVAREVQASLLPQEMPALPGWDLAAAWQPARVVGGDFYDLIPDLASGDRLGAVIADVSDKGMPAALFMAATRSTLRGSMAGRLAAPEEGIARANRLICADSTGGMFVTLFYAGLSAGSGELVYVNAGHNPAYLCRPDRAKPVPLGRTGLLLGFAEDAEYAAGRCELAPGDFVVLYTDGLTEAINAAGEEFGEARLCALLESQCGAGAAEIVAAIEAALHEHAGALAPFDDVTVVVVRRAQ